MTFREEVKKSILKNNDLETLLDRIETIHRRHRNTEIVERLKQAPKNSAFDRALGRKGDVYGRK